MLRWFGWKLLGGLWLICGIAAVAQTAATGHIHAWSEMTGDGISLRAIAAGSECPNLSVDGKPVVMTIRSTGNTEFPVTACQATAPAGAKSAMIDGQRLALAPRRLKRIVVIGDTGCRLKGAQVQDCNDPKMWPFATVTKNAAAKNPDLVIHVGDYYYRETPCPATHPGCSGSPHGDSWESWRLDFFEPASPLLAAAPWIFARGNHEQCGRGSAGWFRFLDAGSAPLTCPATAAPFAVRLDRLQMDVIDTADVVDKQLSIDRLAFYQAQISAIPVTTSGKKPDATWVVTHKPLWGYELTRAGQSAMADNPMLAAAAGMMDKPKVQQLPNVDLLLAGHVHLFGALDFSSGETSLRPAQLIVGDSGTALDSADVRTGEEGIDGLVAKYVVKGNFGYFVFDRKKKGWSGTLYSVDDAVLVRCNQVKRQIACEAR